MLDASHEILDECIAVGGSVTGEHGIGVEKMEFMPRLFGPEDLAAMVALRSAFNPDGRCSPTRCSRPAAAASSGSQPRPPGLGLMQPRPDRAVRWHATGCLR